MSEDLAQRSRSKSLATKRTGASRYEPHVARVLLLLPQTKVRELLFILNALLKDPKGRKGLPTTSSQARIHLMLRLASIRLRDRYR